MREWEKSWVAKGKGSILGLDVAGDLVFHADTRMVVNDVKSGAVISQHFLASTCEGVSASRKGPRALFPGLSGDLFLLERAAGGQWSAKSVAKLADGAKHAVWNSDESLIAVACFDKFVYVLDATSLRRVARLGPFSTRVWRVAFSPDGALIYGTDSANEIRVFGLVDGFSWSEIAIISQGQASGFPFSRGLALSPDGRYLVCDLSTVGLCVWKVPTMPLKSDSWEEIAPINTFQGYGRAFNICFAGSDHFIVPDDIQKTLRVFSIGKDEKVALVTAIVTENTPNAVAFDAYRGILLVGDGNGSVHALQAKNYTPSQQYTPPSAHPVTQTAPHESHGCLRSRKSTISARIAKIDGDMVPIAKALGAEGVNAGERIGHLAEESKRLEAELKGVKETLASLRAKYGDKVDQLGALKGERASLVSELAELDRALSDYLSHVSGGAHHVSGHDIGIALCDSGACSLVGQPSRDAISKIGASTGTLIGKNTSDLASALEMSYAVASNAVAELQRLLAFGRDLPTSASEPLPPRTGMLAWKHADVITFLEKATVDAAIVAAFKAMPKESAWGGPALAFADALHLMDATHCPVWQSQALVSLIAKEKEHQIAAKRLPAWMSTWSVSIPFARSLDPEAELAEVVAEMAALELQFGPPPTNITCPITKRVMKDPVLAADDAVYERLALLARFAKGNMTSPVDPTIVLSTSLTASVRTQRNIAAWQGN